MRIVTDEELTAKTSDEYFYFEAFKHSHRGKRLAGEIMGLFLGGIFLILMTAIAFICSWHGTQALLLVFCFGVAGYGGGKFLSLKDPQLPGFIQKLRLEKHHPTQEEFDNYKIFLKNALNQKKKEHFEEIEELSQKISRLEDQEHSLLYKLQV